jgi:hypothetical protein
VGLSALLYKIIIIFLLSKCQRIHDQFAPKPGCSMPQYFPGLVNTERFITGGGFASNPGSRTLSSPVNQIGSTSSPFILGTSGIMPSKVFPYSGKYFGGTTGVSGGFNVQSVGATVHLWTKEKPIINQN